MLPGLVAALISLHSVAAFVTDDAAITLRYAAELAGGHGIRWNPGEHPVEGYSNFSHVLLGALAIELGLPALSTLRLLNQACFLIVCVLAYALALEVLGSRLWASVAALVIGAHPAFAYWACSGLETAAYTALSYAGIYASLRLGSRRALLPGIALLLAALTRFEGAVMFAAVLAALLFQVVRERRLSVLGPHLSWIGLFACGYGAYFIWRLVHFGHLLPNSAYYKVGEPNGFALIQQFAAQNAVLLVLAFFADLRQLGRLGSIAIALVLAYLAGFYGVKDSVADFHRFFLPIVPAIALLAVSSLRKLWPGRGASHARMVFAAAAVMVALAFDGLHPVSGFANLRAEATLLNTRIVSRATAASVVAERIGSDSAVAVDDVGVIGFALRNPILDIFGLNDERFIHRFERQKQPYERFVLEQSPGAVIAVSKDPLRFNGYYMSSAFLVGDPSFGARYAQLEVVRSPVERYHYFVFVRRDLLPAQRKRELALKPGLGLAGMVDDLFRRVRREGGGG